MTYIEEYKEGNKFFGIYLCKSKQILKTKAGKTYYSLLLQDKTGIIDAKVWELNNGIDDFDSMDFIMHPKALLKLFFHKEIQEEKKLTKKGFIKTLKKKLQRK